MTHWPRLEKRVREVLSQHYDKQFSDGIELQDASEALDQISDIFGEETDRGFEYEDAQERNEG